MKDVDLEVTLENPLSILYVLQILHSGNYFNFSASHDFILSNYCVLLKQKKFISEH